jgi:tetratricopeptide (TPR) repeat protein
LNIEQIESRINRRPYSPLFARLAAEYLSAGRIQEAKELCTSGLENYPAYSTAYFVLAKCFQKEENYPSALQNLRAAKSLNPNSQVLDDLERNIEKLLIPISKEQTQSDVAPLSPTDQVSLQVAEPQVPDYPTIVQTDVISSSDENIDTHSTLSPELLIETTVKDVALVQDKVADIPTSPEPAEAIDDTKDTEILTATIDEGLTQDQETESSIASITESVIEVPVEEVVQHQEPLETTIETLPELKPIDKIYTPEKEQTETKILLPEFLDDGRIVSKTLAEIYADQGEYQEAILTYRLLKQTRPNLTDEIDIRISELENKLHIKIEQH